MNARHPALHLARLRNHSGGTAIVRTASVFSHGEEFSYVSCDSRRDIEYRRGE